MTLNRVVALMLFLVLGYGLGGAVAGLILIFLAGMTGGPSGEAHQFVVVAAGLAGASLGFWRWRGRGAPIAPSEVHGSARFSRPEEDRSSLDGETGLMVGRLETARDHTPSPRAALGPKGPILHFNGPSHILTIAPTRSGKGAGAVMPNLLTCPRPVICVDIKGENARISARARERFGPVFVLDPFGASGCASAAFNPLAGMDPLSPDLGEDAASIADALVFDPPDQLGEAHWNEEAKALITGIILHVVTACQPSDRHLATVRDLLTGSPDQLIALLDDMQASAAAGGLVARAANRHLSKSDREGAGVLSAAQRHTHFLDSPRICEVLNRSDFTFEDLRTERVTVFLVLPPDRLATHARWLRLMVAQGLGALVRSPPPVAGPAPEPVLMLLDEFAALGHLAPVLNAFGLMAGYGVQLWVILQDLHQLKNTYGRGFGTFLSNAGLIQVFNVADLETAIWVSKSLGATTEAYLTSGASSSSNSIHWFPSTSKSSHLNLARRELLTPDEVMRMSGDHLILFRPGARPTIARKLRYYEDPEFKGLFDP